MRRLRSSFAAKLLAGGIALALVIVGSVAGYLIYSRDSQTRAGALSNSDNRVAVMREVLEQFTGEQSYATASGLATQTPLIAALAGTDPAREVPALFAGSPPVNLAAEVLVITDANGRPLYTRAAPDLGAVDQSAFDSSQAIVAALSGTECGFARSAGACGLEILGGGLPAYSVAVPVSNGLTPVGVVAYIAPLALQLERFATLFQFPTAFIPAGNPSLELRQHGSAVSTDTAPPAVTAGIQSGVDLVHATYSAPTGTGGAGQDVAGSFVAVAAPGGGKVAGYLGIEVPLSQFVGDEATDELTLGVITLFVLLALTLLIILFVEVVVRRPIRRLERGVARIAGGDYTSPVVVRSNDELGRLASSVNRMRDSIRVYTTEIQDARQRLDSAVGRVGNVSRALTTTTGGVPALEQEVVRAAAAIAGEGTTALLATRDGDQLHVQSVHPPDSAPEVFEGWERFGDVLAGSVVRDSQPGRGAFVAVPMFYQERVVGALCVVNQAATKSFAEDEEDVLVVLANNTAVAMENARLFEQERETVRRLRQLDAMKTDFLSTVQHELRTPLTAILGLSDLLEMCWTVWEDSPKVEAVHDIQVAARNLYDIVETIIDFSAVDAETLDVAPAELPLAEVVQKGVESVAERYKDGLPIPVNVDIDPALHIWADPDRFSQVLRALLDNAVKFSDEQGAVSVTAHPAAEGSAVEIRIRDQGIGIPPDDRERIFERFFQVDNTATRRYGGTGMGLALVKRLVEVHHATISVESELGAGTTMVLLWPTEPVSTEAGATTTAPPGGDETPDAEPAASAAPVQ